MRQVQLCLSVLSLGHTCFQRAGNTDLPHSAAFRAARSIPKGVTGSAPNAYHLLGSLTKGSRALLSPLASLLHSHRTAEYCVRYSRAGGMKVLKCGTAAPSCSDAWTQESSRIHSHLPEPRHCALGSSRIHSHLHEARNAFASVLCPRVIADTLASPRTFANAHHSHFLFTVTRHSSATSPRNGRVGFGVPGTRHA